MFSNWRKVLSPYFVLALSLSITAQSQASIETGKGTEVSTGSHLPSIPFEKYKLKNGLEVILSEDHRLPMVSTNIWYHVGPANERPGLTGFAHLFEHMMFEGSKHVGAKAHFKYLEAAGASDINGTTDFDRTNFFETLPSNQLELALWLESDRMGYLQDKLDNEKLSNQRDVVRNERRQSVENAPYGLVDEATFHELFPKGHPYYASVIGSHADIEAARLKDLREFFKQYYSTNNASLAIVGDFDKTQVKALVEKYFGSLPPGPPVPRVDVQTPPITAEKRITVTDQVELPRITMAWLGAPIFKPGDAEADLISRILGGGKSSRLYKKLVYEMQIAQDVAVGNQSLTLGSVFVIKATAKPGVKPEELEKAIDAELAAFRKDGPTQTELDGARNTIEANMIEGLEHLGGYGGVADRLNQYNHYLGDPGFLGQDIQRYDKATIADLKNTADKYLQNNNRVVVYAVPGKKVVDDVARAAEEKVLDEKVTAAPDEPWRNTAPKAGPAVKLNLPVPKVFELKNGLKVYLLEKHNLPIISASLILKSGSDKNPIDKAGLSSFTADMLEYGTSSRSATKIAEDLEQLGTSLFTYSNSDSSRVQIQTLSKTADGGFEILSDLALHPVFADKEIERDRQLRITAIDQEKDQPPEISKRIAIRALYGAEHPYAYENHGTVKSVKSFTKDDIHQFWHLNYTPSNAALIIAGDMDEAQARSMSEKYFGSWKGIAVSHKSVEAKSTPQRSVYIVNKEAAPQTAMLLSSIGLARSNPDYASAEVANNILGGMFNSRLNMNLREKHGYTYGAFSAFDYRRAAGPFFMMASVRTDVTAPAISESFNVLESMHKVAASAEEMTTAKDNLVLSLPADFETTVSSTRSLSRLFVYDLPLDYFQSLPGKINAVTPSEVSNAVGKYMKPASTIVVLVGDKAKILPEVQKLNLGKIQELDAEANPVNSK